MLIKNTKQKAYKYGGKTFVDIKIEVELDKWDDFDSLKERLNINVPWMAPHICQWGDYDYSYSIQLFVDSLEALGRGLLRWDNVIGSTRNGRRALTAAAMLKRAYNYESWDDKSYRNWSRRQKHVSIPISAKGNTVLRKYAKYFRLDTVHDFGNAMRMDREEYANKMWKIIYKRQQRVEAELKLAAWQYIKKYVEHWWD